MLGLAIHTSSPQLGLALQSTEQNEKEAISRHQVWDLGREVSSHLHVKLIEFIAPYSWQDLCFVAVAKGPGGFTGTRIGVVAARTLAQQLEIPLFGISSTAAIAADAQIENQDIAVMMPAKREAVFGAIYRPDSKGNLQSVLGDEGFPEDKWSQVIASWDRPLQQVSIEMGEGIAASVAGVMKLAYGRWRQGERPEWNSVMPFYGQHPVNR